MELNVRTPDGSTLVVPCDHTFTLADVKKKIEDEIHVPQDFQNLYYGGKKLETPRTLAYYDLDLIAGPVWIHLVVLPVVRQTPPAPAPPHVPTLYWTGSPLLSTSTEYREHFGGGQASPPAGSTTLTRIPK